ncbi:GNAT family acetyltransferase [Microbacterium stercoris]|uniref:GNAT family acetyltransferase n=1 Tax=Microbacterium stercoris TaxID=2820289 RepID=A0A939TQD6_9MICO|nr:GNAT family acetyltransferase [Microbacterium stercoris]MBO3663360.1 GNAT family acetyltransferase [Microbacterium stercoris]
MTIEIRSFRPSDQDQVVSLWHAAGLTRPWNDPVKDIERARAVWPELLLVAAEGELIVGSVMAGYDGHRGWLYYLASAPDRRGAGIGRRLVAEAEARLEALGCPKVMLMVRADNERVLEYYDAAGYTRETSRLTGRRLIADH